MSGYFENSLRTALTAMPKVELHRHLEGSLRLETLVEIANQYDVDVPARDLAGLRPHVQVMPGDPATAPHFLSKFNVLRRFYCAPEVIYRLAKEAVIDAAADNVQYMELRFTPKALARLRDFDFCDVARWVCSAVEDAQREHPAIQVALIVSVNRHERLDEAEQMMRAAVDLRHRGIVGFDLCGQELGYPAALFAGIVREAAQSGLQITLHAGEWDGPYNVQYAVETLGVSRIGHGVRVLEDPLTAALARERGILFEVCPTSNVHSGVVPGLAHHPLRAMRDAGLRISLNTDDPSISGITLSHELIAGAEALGLSLEALRHMTLEAARSAFLPDADRQALVARLTTTLERFDPPVETGSL